MTDEPPTGPSGPVLQSFLTYLLGVIPGAVQIELDEVGRRQLGADGLLIARDDAH